MAPGVIVLTTLCEKNSLIPDGSLCCDQIS